MLIGRRSLVAAAAGLGVGLPGRARAQTDYLAELHAKARTEGEVTWYIVYWPSDRAEKHAALFTQTYPGVKVNVVRTTAQVAYQRLNQNIRANVANRDMFASTDMSQYLTLKRAGHLMPYRMHDTDRIDPRFLNVDPDNAYQIVNATAVGFGINTNKVKPEAAPKDWRGLLDPKWRGQIVVGHPGFSGFVGTWVVQMNKMFGWSYFEQVAALKPHVGRSTIDTVTLLASGERNIGASPLALVQREAAAGNPFAPAYPENGSVLMISGGAIMANTKHPNAAKLLMKFLYSAQTAGEDVEEFGIPLHTETVLPAGLKRLADMKTVRPAIEKITAGIPELTEKWRDTFGV